MKDALGPNAHPYFPGAIAQVVIKRYFLLNYTCGAVALAHLAAEWLYLGWPPKSFKLGLLIGVVVISLWGGLWVQPGLKELHRTMYFAPTAEQREEARRTFRRWHGASRVADLLAMACLAVYFWRTVNAAESPRCVGWNKLRS